MMLRKLSLSLVLMSGWSMAGLLHEAVFRKDVKRVYELLMDGANPHEKDEDGGEAVDYAGIRSSFYPNIAEYKIMYRMLRHDCKDGCRLDRQAYREYSAYLSIKERGL